MSATQFVSHDEETRPIVELLLFARRERHAQPLKQREGQPSLSVLVAGEDQLDRYFLDHPDEVFSRAPEPAVVNVANPFVLDPHLACAAYERPLKEIFE